MITAWPEGRLACFTGHRPDKLDGGDDLFNGDEDWRELITIDLRAEVAVPALYILEG